MNEEKIRELQEYNLEYMEARISENEFGGDYTSAVELKHANKIIEQLQRENRELKEEVRAVNRGLKKVRFKRAKWKNRYYQQKKELKNLKESWDKLEEWIKERYSLCVLDSDYEKAYERIWSKMEKLKGSENK